MQSIIIFLSIVVVALSLVIVRFGAVIRKLRDQLGRKTRELTDKRLERKAEQQDADHWCSLYSRAELERIHLEIERDSLRRQLMCKNGAGTN